MGAQETVRVCASHVVVRMNSWYTTDTSLPDSGVWGFTGQVTESVGACAPPPPVLYPPGESTPPNAALYTEDRRITVRPCVVVGVWP